MKAHQQNTSGKAAFAFILSIGLLLSAIPAFGQQEMPLTNADVVSMVKSGLSETVILGLIKSRKNNFDTSPKGLIALQRASIPPKVMQAMIDATGSAKTTVPAAPAGPAAPAAIGAPSPPAASTAPPVTTPATPTGAAATPVAPIGGAPAGVAFALLTASAKQPLATEKLQVTPTNSKQSSLQALALDKALNEVLKAGVQDIATRLKAHTKIEAPGVGVTQVGTVIGGLFGGKKSKPTFTYVWALPGATSSTPAAAAANFEINYAGMPGINPDDYEPHIVKLALTKDQGWRLVGAAKATEDVAQSTSPTWPVYSGFIEETIPAQTRKLGPGHVIVSPASLLPAGEYAVSCGPWPRTKSLPALI